MQSDTFSSELLAPCGIICATCKQYLARQHDAPKKRATVSHCIGCIPRGKNCYIKRSCQQLTKHKIQSCSQCEVMPCQKLAHLDKRYRTRYNTSLVDNLQEIKAKGIEQFLKEQKDRYRCPNCGDVVCIHDNKCYKCGYTKQLNT